MKDKGDTTNGVAELRKLFDSLDQDHDGSVDSKEWGKMVHKNQKVLAKFFGGKTVKEIGQKFKTIDKDGNDRLSWEEFLAYTGLEDEEEEWDEELIRQG